MIRCPFRKKSVWRIQNSRNPNGCTWRSTTFPPTSTSVTRSYISGSPYLPPMPHSTGSAQPEEEETVAVPPAGTTVRAGGRRRRTRPPFTAI